MHEKKSQCSYHYREIRKIVLEEQHIVTDFFYKLYLVSINFATLRHAKCLPVFSALLN
jgi:hypothetical protein